MKSCSSGEIAFLRGGHQSCKKPLPLGGVCRSSAFVSDVLAGASDQLARVGLGDLKDVCDFAVGVIEGLAEDVGCAFVGRELLEQQQNGELEGLATFGSKGWVRAGVDGLGKPGADVGLATGTRRLREVDGQARCRGDEKRGCVMHGCAIGGLPAQPGVLHDVLGFGDGPEHAVGDAEETRAHA
jgi:hypothetical protein